MDESRLPARFWAKVDRRECWTWTGAMVTPGGYGQIHWKGRMCVAHRGAYEALVGPVGDGLELDHLCRNPTCVNPAHLEPVSHSENVRRGAGAAFHRNKTHCPKGHRYDADNTYVCPRGQRNCRECGREAVRRFRQRKRELVSA